MILRVKLRPHPIFSLQGKDVQVELPLAPWEAALGAKVAVPTLGGTVELTIPAGAQAGQKLRLRGRGFPGAPNGDQFVLRQARHPGRRDSAGEGSVRTHAAGHSTSIPEPPGPSPLEKSPAALLAARPGQKSVVFASWVAGEMQVWRA